MEGTTRNLAGQRAVWQHGQLHDTSRLQSTHTHIFVHNYQHYTTQLRKRPKASNG